MPDSLEYQIQCVVYFGHTAFQQYCHLEPVQFVGLETTPEDVHFSYPLGGKGYRRKSIPIIGKC